MTFHSSMRMEHLEWAGKTQNPSVATHHQGKTHVGLDEFPALRVRFIEILLVMCQEEILTTLLDAVVRFYIKLASFPL